MSEFVDNDVVWFEVTVDDAHTVDGINCKNKVGNVYFGKSLLEIHLLSEELSETTATPVIKDKKIQVVDAKRVV